MLAALRIYQWLAIGFVVTGAALTCVPSADVHRSGPWFSAPGWALGAAVAILHALAMGVDFPASDRRFARLAGAA